MLIFLFLINNNYKQKKAVNYKKVLYICEKYGLLIITISY